MKSRTTLSSEYILSAVAAEMESAVIRHGQMSSVHEAYGILAEEFAEYFDEVKKKPALRDKVKMRKELIQIASVALRAAIDTCE